MGPLEFTIDVFQNEYLPAGAREINAIVTVTSAGSALTRQRPRQALRRSSSSATPDRWASRCGTTSFAHMCGYADS